MEKPLHMPCRIGIVVRRIDYGGMELFAIRLGHYLARHGYQVELITVEHRGINDTHLADAPFNVTHLQGHTWLSPRSYAHRVGAYLARQHFDVLFLNDARPAQAALGMLPDSTAVISIIHTDTDAAYQLGCASRDAWNAVVGISPGLHAKLLRLAPEKASFCITHGVESPALHHWRGRVKYAAPFRLVFIGRFVHQQKGVLFLPDILQGCRERGMNVTLALVGSGSDETALQERFTEFGLDAHVSWYRHINDHALYDLLLSAHALLLPSFYEGFGQVLAQAQICGCIPIASRLPGITDTNVQDGHTGMLVDPGDVRGFMQAITMLYCAPERWGEMSENAHEYAQEEFSADDMGERYLQLIADAMDGHYPLTRSRRTMPPVNAALLAPEPGTPPIVAALERRFFPKTPR